MNFFQRIVFRVLCGEWIESMWVCLECAGWPCIPFFLFTFVIGNLVVLNLFLALLLASFGSNVFAEREKENDENKIGEAIDRIQRCFRFIIRFIYRLCCRRKRQKRTINEDEIVAYNRVCFFYRLYLIVFSLFFLFLQALPATHELITSYPLPTLFDFEKFNSSLILTNDSALMQEGIEMQPINSNTFRPVTFPKWQLLHMPPDCCPRIISKHFAWCAKCIPKSVQQRWTYFRSQAHRLVEHRYFEWLIIASILASSTTLVSL